LIRFAEAVIIIKIVNPRNNIRKFHDAMNTYPKKKAKDANNHVRGLANAIIVKTFLLNL
jgi:hypothetical protein